jgi:hypothetical protein
MPFLASGILRLDVVVLVALSGGIFGLQIANADFAI